jgi:hypothetical protein
MIREGLAVSTPGHVNALAAKASGRSSAARLPGDGHVGRNVQGRAKRVRVLREDLEAKGRKTSAPLHRVRLGMGESTQEEPKAAEEPSGEEGQVRPEQTQVPNRR